MLLKQHLLSAFQTALVLQTWDLIGYCAWPCPFTCSPQEPALLIIRAHSIQPDNTFYLRYDQMKKKNLIDIITSNMKKTDHWKLFYCHIYGNKKIFSEKSSASRKGLTDLWYRPPLKNVTRRAHNVSLHAFYTLYQKIWKFVLQRYCDPPPTFFLNMPWNVPLTALT